METQRNQITVKSVEECMESSVNGASQSEGENNNSQTTGVKEASGEKRKRIDAIARRARSISESRSSVLVKSLTEFAKDVSVVGLRYVVNTGNNFEVSVSVVSQTNSIRPDVSIEHRLVTDTDGHRAIANTVSVVGFRYVVNPLASQFRRSVWVLLILVEAAFTTCQTSEVL